VLELWDRVSHAEMRAGMDRVEVLRRAAQAALAIDNGDLALALIDQALREVDPVAEPVRAGLLHERRGVCLEGVTWDDTPTFEAFREAVRLIPADPPTRERARVLASFAEVLFRAGHDEQAHAAGEEALAIARRLGAERELGEALIAVGWTQAARGAIDAGIGSLREAVRLADKHADPHVLAHACGWLGEVLLRAGRLEDAVEVSLSGREPLRRLGLAERWHDNVLLVKAAEALFKLGRWDEADSLARQALAQARPEERCNGHGVAMHEVHMVATLEIARGDFQAAEAHLAAIKDRMLGSVPKFARGYAELLAEVRAWQGRLDQAQAAVQQGLDLVAGTGEQVRSGRLLCLGMRVAADLAEQARARRDPEGVEAALHAANGLAAQAAAMTPNPLVPGASPVVTAGAVGALSDGERSRLAGRSDPARWRATATAWLTLRRPYPAAYAQWRLAEALLEQKQPPNRAAEPLRQAHAAAQRLGARPLLDEVTALARRARIALEEAREEAEPATPSQLEQLGLTEREVEVLEYVAAGRSNREIGEALFISAKTASVHVSNILRKLGVTSRVQAATVAHRLGLFDKQPPEEQGVG
jgi:ATP/maltotriose-dependent transcriptional regulator MalT